MKKVFALVDCNNFYVSCERLFRPELNGKPVVVLTNNDGCIVARSNEAKALGIPMGEPFFKVKHVIAKHKVHVFSSNYALYGDLSHRVMDVLRQMEPDVEVYSIDEAFISLPVTKVWDRVKYAAELRERVRKQVGIPVSIGIATTKTLAKIANRVAKKEEQFNGVFDLAGNSQIDQVLAMTEVNDVWGIGRRSTEKLNSRGIYTALDLKTADETWIRKQLTVVGARTALELNGISCISLENAPPCPKSIITSRSFGHPVTDLYNLREAVINFVSIAGEKLRKLGVEADTLNIFITTGPFDEQASYSNNQTITLHQPTSSTPDLITAALQCLKSLYKPGYRYRKTGVMLAGIVKQGYRQQDLFSFLRPAEKEDKQLMTALDRINSKWGRSTIQYGMTTAEDKPWLMQQTRKSPAYTTNWQELPVAKATGLS
ncbi:MAG: Y-family DNA polymerase [Proteobacteria bacterium]|jgi:DNA polymerase V|nr:Y-family DNA polymerase [Desulfocapsa sp.]MBU3944021.1 Y-family DNA polymerase [Pseudomonadota bacterium]MCG2745559.1 Y-family DNA polymerase [Desulfobacteraceae bacterium]MBU4029490.1 Y-family DNA polymerase [Pseudomonadota bacterium]MBU4043266.1 Y-family DNA polymerase [Pseudomonadota bacterium]